MLHVSTITDDEENPYLPFILHSKTDHMITTNIYLTLWFLCLCQEKDSTGETIDNVFA